MDNQRRGTYYLGRVLKFGELNAERLAQAILNPTPIVRGKHAWTFIASQEYKDRHRNFVFGKLSKYSPDAQVKVVEPALKAEIIRGEPNLSIATSPFIYIPEYSGIAFLHIAPHIKQNTFVKKFCELVEESAGGFFVSCQIELISDLRTFAAKLQLLDGIFEISADVHPPNPLWGPLWMPLKDYIASRRAQTMSIKEEATGEIPLATDLTKHVIAAAEQTPDRPYLPKTELPIGDAAILMAADGYGDGLVKGRQGDQFIIIRTAETVRNIGFEREPDPIKLYDVVAKIFEEMEKQRHMEH